jgi:hypothetical protein
VKRSKIYISVAGDWNGLADYDSVVEWHRMEQIRGKM